MTGMAVLAASALLADAQIEFEPSVDFSAYHTYAWQTGTDARRIEAQKRIVEAVDRELASRGFTLVEERPDVYVSTHALVDRHTPKELADPIYWEFVTGVINIDAFDVRGGTLVVDVTNAKTMERVWRGVVSEPIKRNPGKAFKRIDAAVRSVLKLFPPG